MEQTKDQDRGKGAMEQDQQNKGGNTNMQGQLGHRDGDAELKNADSRLIGMRPTSAAPLSAGENDLRKLKGAK